MQNKMFTSQLGSKSGEIKWKGSKASIQALTTTSLENYYALKGLPNQKQIENSLSVSHHHKQS
jgi:hypothetical protein